MMRIQTRFKKKLDAGKSWFKYGRVVYCQRCGGADGNALVE